ncbi:hypothetical protein QMK17_24655 [Rhodococcus sp. G-MC3]|uniref:hypothetical protein n=1 Tax=Rhodococcus sp. G-MC3 TaxID=3046209 RepID=UPI0024B9B2F5|nr:hypothetical protein [Rhodococcus sp. G-MC3]MDJ0396499.1 hypothetical protein [Rhodococcus sp. G-MC3]
MSESDAFEVAGVPEPVLDGLAAALTEKIDVLLDRLTDRAMAMPQAGSPAWRSHWNERESPSGRAQDARRLYVRAVLASRAGIGTPINAPTPAPPAPAPAARPRTRRSRIDAAQLAMF